MFPSLYVPRSHVPRNLCFPIPMFPGLYVTPSYVPQYLCSPVRFSVHSLFRTFAVSYFSGFSICFCFTRVLFCPFLFNTFLVLHVLFPSSLISFLLILIFNGTYVPRAPMFRTLFILSLRCLIILHSSCFALCCVVHWVLLLFCTLYVHQFLDSYVPRSQMYVPRSIYSTAVYIIRSLCSPGA